MNTRLRVALALLAILVLANIAWRVWANWGLITVDADGAPLASVVQSIEKQGHIRILANAPDGQTVTMHVHRVPLIRALEVLSINVNGACSVAWFAAPDEKSIDAALASWKGSLAGWKRFGLQLPMMGGFGAIGDPREETWSVDAVAEPKLQAYLDQASIKTGAEFWAPEGWNPDISKAPAGGNVGAVVKDLASAAGGRSEQVFLLNISPRMQGMAFGAPPPQSSRQTEGGFADGQPPGPPMGGPGGPPDEKMQEAMEARELARIAKLPADQQAAAKAEFDERKKFFESLQGLSEEEARQKIQDRMEADMRGGQTQMEQRMIQMDAMRTATQRADFYRRVIQNKEDAGR